jgi:hypothetical protein
MAPLFSVTVFGYREAAGKFAGYASGLADSQREMARYVGRTGVSILRREAPKRSGIFAQGINYRTHQTGPAQFEARFYSSGPHAFLDAIIRYGSVAHVIAARNKPVLKFYWAKGPNGAGIYYYKRVNHPGTKPNDYVGRAMPELRDLAISEFRSRAIRVFAR